MHGIRHIVVDGHSVIYQIPALCALHRTNQRHARERLIAALTHLQDYTGMRVHLVYDGRTGSSRDDPPSPIAIKYATSHQTADSLIERAVAAAPHPDQIAVVTADRAEGSLISSLGATCMDPLALLALLDENCPGWVEENLSKKPNHKSKR